MLLFWNELKNTLVYGVWIMGHIVQSLFTNKITIGIRNVYFVVKCTHTRARSQHGQMLSGASTRSASNRLSMASSRNLNSFISCFYVRFDCGRWRWWWRWQDAPTIRKLLFILWPFLIKCQSFKEKITTKQPYGSVDIRKCIFSSPPPLLHHRYCAA